jgi:hypothetical protein
LGHVKVEHGVLRFRAKAQLNLPHVVHIPLVVIIITVVTAY